MNKRIRIAVGKPVLAENSGLTHSGTSYQVAKFPDFDKPENYGRIYGKELAGKHNLIQIEIPEYYESKDPFQFRTKHGEEIFKNTFNFLINGN